MTASQARLHLLLIHVLVEHDRQQMKKRGFNPYALAQYLGALGDVFVLIEKGEHLESTLSKHFEGRLLTKLLKLVGKAK